MSNMITTFIFLTLSLNAFSDYAGGAGGSRKDLMKKNKLHSDFSPQNYTSGSGGRKAPGRNKFAALPPEAIVGYTQAFSYNNQTIKVKINKSQKIMITGGSNLLKKHLKEHIKQTFESQSLGKNELTATIEEFMQAYGR